MGKVLHHLMVSIAGGEDDWYLRVSKKDPDITVSDSYKTGNDGSNSNHHRQVVVTPDESDWEVITISYCTVYV